MQQPSIQLQHQQSNSQPSQNSKNLQQYSYFIEGYELPAQQQLIRNRLLTHLPTLKTKNYRESLLKIVTSFSQLGSFSDNLQRKVDSLLQAQQSTFVESYKHHINKIKVEFDQLNKHIQELQQKIRYYQNEGQMSSLVKKVFQLEQESAKLFKMIAAKDKKIRDLQLTITVLQREMKIMKDTVKSTVRQKSEMILRSNGMNSQDEEDVKVRLEDITVFATQLTKKGSTTAKNEIPRIRQFQPFQNSPNRLSKSLTVDVKSPNEKQNDRVASVSNKVSLYQEQIKKDNVNLRQLNKKLVSRNVRLVQEQNDLEDFFIKCVEELKKEIRIRKKMDHCTLQDFRKQDKLQLLIKVLSNDQILTYLHQRIFSKQPSSSSVKRMQEDQGSSKNLKPTDKLPKINFYLAYQKK